jgi:Holliday junction resolvase
MNSRDKGKRGERELANWLEERGYAARRGQQHRGGEDSPDVICPDLPFHFEVKRTERLKLYEAMEQAIEDAGGGIPVVAHRRNRGDWVGIVRLIDLIDLWKTR